jgi:Rrf2 family protein
VDKILNVSDRTNAALHALALVAVSPGAVAVPAIAARLGVSPSYLAKTLQPLARAGILSSTRGPSGGFALAKEAAAVSCLEVMELLDGPISERQCLFEKAVCENGCCSLGLLCDQVAAELIAVFGRTSIADLARSF